VPRESRTDTLGDLAYTQKLYANCGACRRSVPLDIRAMIERYGPKLSIASVKQRIRCARCGERTNDLRIVYTTTGR